jgi:hypothetical protein
MASKVAFYLFGLGGFKSLFSLLDQPHCLRRRAVVYADLEETRWFTIEARHNLVFFDTNCESEAEDERVHERTAKT